MLERLTSKFVDDCAQWWRYWSNQFAILVGTVTGVLVESQAIILPYLSDLPKPWNGIVAGLLVVIPPVLLRMLKQPGLERKP
jgi:uncharacterized membrane protein